MRIDLAKELIQTKKNNYQTSCNNIETQLYIKINLKLGLVQK